MLNVEKLKELYDWAVASQEGLDRFFEEHPNYAKHKQGAWGEVIKNGVCQTAFCLAGQTAVDAGYTFFVEKYDWADLSDNRRYATPGQLVPTDMVHELGLTFVKGSGKTFAHAKTEAISDEVAYGGKTLSAMEIATEELGIEDWEASRLFSGGNDVEDIRYYINMIFENHGLPDRLVKA